MPPTGTIRVEKAKFFQDLNISNGSVPTNSDHGVVVPGARRGQYVHFLAEKSNVAAYDIYGMTNSTGRDTWVIVETFNMDREANQGEPLRGLTGYMRVASVRTDANVQDGGHTNTWFGFGE